VCSKSTARLFTGDIVCLGIWFRAAIYHPSSILGSGTFFHVPVVVAQNETGDEMWPENAAESEPGSQPAASPGCWQAAGAASSWGFVA